MTKARSKIRIFLLALAGLLSVSAQAQNLIRYEAQPSGSKVKLQGSSTIHDWSADCAVIGGFMEVSPAFDADLKTPTPPPKVQITIPVRQLKTSEGKSMDKVMYEHLNLPEHPTIKYQLISLTPKEASQFDAQGALTISGVTRTNTMPVSFERVDKTKIKVKGNTSLKMTDFGVKPPAPSILGMSLIKTDDNVKLSFEWTVAQPEKAPDAK
jgi:polyisoprenoid-binding protein YceI